MSDASDTDDADQEVEPVSDEQLLYYLSIGVVLGVPAVVALIHPGGFLRNFFALTFLVACAWVALVAAGCVRAVIFSSSTAIAEIAENAAVAVVSCLGAFGLLVIAMVIAPEELESTIKSFLQFLP